MSDKLNEVIKFITDKTCPVCKNNLSSDSELPLSEAHHLIKLNGRCGDVTNHIYSIRALAELYNPLINGNVIHVISESLTIFTEFKRFKVIRRYKFEISQHSNSSSEIDSIAMSKCDLNDLGEPIEETKKYSKIRFDGINFNDFDIDKFVNKINNIMIFQ